jgi:hypothetical protein
VHCEVGLAVAIEIQVADWDAIRDRLLEDPGRDLAALPAQGAGYADVN